MTSRGAKYWNSGAIPLIAPDILGNIITEVADIALVVTEQGKILSVLVNPDNPAFKPIEKYEGRDIRQALAIESAEKFDARMAEFLAGQTLRRGVELNHADDGGMWSFPVRYSFHQIGPDGAILLLGRDLRPVAEMQQQLVNAQLALERDYEAQRESDTRFRVMMESTREPIVFVSLQSGQVTEANSAAAELLGVDETALIGKSFSPEFELRERGDLIEALSSAAMTDRSSPVSVTLRKGGAQLHMTPTLFRAAGQRLLMCRIEPEDEHAVQADGLSRNLNALYEQGPDAIVFADSDGSILSANDGFLSLIDTAHDLNVKGRSLADYLQRGSVDLKVMIDNAARSGRMRMFPTKISGAFGGPRSVEIAITSLDAGGERIFGFLIRDVSRMDQVRPVNAPVTDDNVRSVMELVGSAALKEIVAETTNVVERMCIETAVELTMNNRVAAAEMLGLSRQSLYVKLRKYGLLSRDEPES